MLKKDVPAENMELTGKLVECSDRKKNRKKILNLSQ